MKPTLQVIGVLLLILIFGPPYAVIYGIAIWFGWHEKRKWVRS